MTDSPLSSDDHVRRAMEGDVGSFAWLTERYTPLVMVHAEKNMGQKVRARTEPGDVAARAVMKMAKWIAGKKPPEEPKALFLRMLFQFANKSIIDLSRRAFTSTALDSELAASEEGGGGTDEITRVATSFTSRVRRGEFGEKVRELASSLDELEAVILVENMLLGRSIAEIARERDLDVEVLRKRKSRLRAKWKESPPVLIRETADAIDFDIPGGSTEATS